MKRLLSLFAVAAVGVSFLSTPVAQAYEWDYNALRSEIRKDPANKKVKDKAMLAKGMLIDELFNGAHYVKGSAETAKVKVEYVYMQPILPVIYDGYVPETLAPHIAYFYEGAGMFRMAEAPAVGTLGFKFTNKTDKVVKIDLDQSIITINGSQQRPLRGNVRKMDEAIGVQPPLVIAPHTTITQEFWHASPPKGSFSVDEMYCNGYYLLGFDRETLGQQMFFDGDDYAILNTSLIFSKDKLTHEKL